MLVLYKDFFDSILTIFVAPGVLAIEIAILFDTLVYYVGNNGMAPSIIDEALPVLTIRSFGIA